MQDLMPYLIPAAIAALTAVLVAYYTSRGTERRLRETYERELSPQKLARQVFLAKRARCLPFTMLKAHFGGMEDDHLRRALLAAGALRFRADDGGEEWGLISRNKSRLAKPEALFDADVPVVEASPSNASASEPYDAGTMESEDIPDFEAPSIDETSEFPDEIEELAPKASVSKRAPSGIASRGRDVGVSLRRNTRKSKSVGEDRLIGELKN